MKFILKSFLLAMFFSTTVFSMVEDADDQKAAMVPDDGIIPRAKWGARAANAKNGLDRHEPIKIVIGHTVTDAEDSQTLLLAIQDGHMGKGWADIGYHFLLDEHDCFECRDLEYMPALLYGHNKGSCAVGIKGCFDGAEKIKEITDEMIGIWAKHIAAIARRMGIKELIRGKNGNIFTMCELSQKYPYSPGKHFRNRLDEIVKLANAHLDKK